MDKRAISAAVLSMAVLLGYQHFFLNPQLEAQRQARLEEARKTAALKAGQGAARMVEITRGAKPKSTQPAPVEIPEPGRPSPAKDIVVDTGAARIVLTTLGAGVKGLTLLRYKDSSGNFLDLVSDKGTPKGGGQGRDGFLGPKLAAPLPGRGRRAGRPGEPSHLLGESGFADFESGSA